MTSATDSIVNSLILIGTVVVLMIIVTTVTLRESATAIAQDQSVYFEERTNTVIETFLASSENQTKLSMRELIGLAMYDLSTTITIDSEVVDVKEQTKKRLDLMLGEDNYYVTIDPIVKGVALTFVLDSSQTVLAEREKIAANMETIQQELLLSIRERGEGDEQVFTQILILPGREPGLCEQFLELGLANTRCQELSTNALYDDLLENGWQLPSFGLGDYSAWERKDTYASMRDFASSDWAAGSAIAGIRFENSFVSRQVSFNAIIPLSDELSTSSKSDRTFNVQGVVNYLVGSMCETECPVARSQESVNQAIEFLSETKNRVFPIHSVDCDFGYDAGYNDFSLNPSTYTQTFMGAGSFTRNEYPQETWCSQPLCGGCDSTINAQDPTKAEVCLYTRCENALFEQMTMLAQATRGSVISVHSPEEIPSRIIDSFEQVIQEFNFTIGERDETRDRFVYQKIVPLPNGFLTQVTVWAYNE